MKICPFLKSECTGHGCAFYTHLLGTHPQTKAPTDVWECALAVLPVLLVENANEQRKTAASVQSFRNEMVKMPNLEMSHIVWDPHGEKTQKLPDRIV